MESTESEVWEPEELEACNAAIKMMVSDPSLEDSFNMRL
jgi:hypothetical protein